MEKAIETKQIRCCIYARVSTDEQAERDLSIPFQLERCRYHAKGAGWELTHEFVDAGESARTDKRPDFQKMISAARAREFDVILVHKFDRFARNDYDFVVYEKELGELGITLESLSEPGDASTPAGYIGRRMMQVISTWYSKNLAIEVKKGLIKSVENGGWPRRAPFGYLNKHDKSSVWIEVDPKNSHFVTEAFKEMAIGKWTLESWAEQAYSLGCRSREGNKVSRMKWSEIFHHRFYLGETWLRAGDIPVKGKQPSLIDEETFAMVQQVLKDHDKHRQRTHRHKYLLRGIVRSVEANSSCSVETNNLKKISYYRSREKVNGKQVFYNTRNIEKQIPAVLSEVTISEEGRQDLRKYVAKFFTDEIETVIEVKNAEARLAKLERMEKNLQVLFMEEGISQQDFREHRSRIESERSKLKNTVDVIKQRQHLVKADFEIALDLCAQLDLLWQKGDFDEKRLLCETIFKEIHLEGGRIARVVFNAPFAMIAAYVRGHGSVTVGSGGAEGIRTPYLITASDAFSQVNYGPA
jgi:site-specific DNA recombinase